MADTFIALPARRSVLQDVNGNPVAVTAGRLEVSSPNVISSGNSSTTPLAGGATFTGSWEEVIAYTNITVLVRSDVASATSGLVLEYSIDGVTADDSDSYTVPANNGQNISVGVFARYFRLRYTNGASVQATMRLQTIYHPIAEKASSHRIDDAIAGDNDAELVKAVLTGKDPFSSFVNARMTTGGDLRISAHDAETGQAALVDPFGALKISSLQRLLGGNFFGTTLDTERWTATGTVAPGTTVVSSGRLTLATGAGAAGAAILTTTDNGRFLSGQINAYQSGVRLGDTGVAGNTRRWGIFDALDGFFFQLSGTTFGVVSRKAGVDTVVTTLSGPNTFTLNTNIRTYEIIYSAGSARFYVDRQLIHTTTNPTDAICDHFNFKLRYENVNAGNATDRSMFVRGASLNRLGGEIPRPLYRSISTLGDRTFKVGAGNLQKIIFSNPGTPNTTIKLFDGLSAAGSLIAEISVNRQDEVDFDVAFNDGLFLQTPTELPLGRTIGNFVVLFD